MFGICACFKAVDRPHALQRRKPALRRTRINHSSPWKFSTRHGGAEREGFGTLGASVDESDTVEGPPGILQARPRGQLESEGSGLNDRHQADGDY